MLRRLAIAAKPMTNQGIVGPVVLVVVGWVREAAQVTGASVATRPSLISLDRDRSASSADLATLGLLVAVSEAGSLNAAARMRGISQPAASARFKEFEARWQVAILHRSARVEADGGRRGGGRLRT